MSSVGDLLVCKDLECLTINGSSPSSTVPTLQTVCTNGNSTDTVVQFTKNLDGTITECLLNVVPSNGAPIPGAADILRYTNSSSSVTRLAGNGDILTEKFKANSVADVNGTAAGTSKSDNPLVSEGSLYVAKNIYTAAIPTTDPAVAGQIWSNNNVLQISTG